MRPHLYKECGYWNCVYTIFIGRGTSPTEAFKNMLLKRKEFMAGRQYALLSNVRAG